MPRKVVAGDIHISGTCDSDGIIAETGHHVEGWLSLPPLLFTPLERDAVTVIIIDGTPHLAEFHFTDMILQRREECSSRFVGIELRAALQVLKEEWNLPWRVEVTVTDAVTAEQHLPDAHDIVQPGEMYHITRARGMRYVAESSQPKKRGLR